MTATRTLLTVLIVQYTLASYLQVVAMEGAGESGKKYDWKVDSYFDGVMPKTIGVAVVVHENVLSADSKKSPLSIDIAQEKQDAWLNHRPDLDANELAIKFRERIAKDFEGALRRIGCAVVPRVMEQPSTMRQFLTEFPECDAICAICVHSVTTGIDGNEMVSAIAITDFVLLSNKLTPVAGRSFASIPSLAIVGEVDRDFDNANPFQNNMSYRFTNKAFLDALVPSVLNGIEELLAQSLRAMYRTWTSSDGREVVAAFRGFRENTVKIRRQSDGRIFSIPLDRLSEEDQVWVTRSSASVE